MAEISTPLATSSEIRDRGSAFVAYVYRARTTEEARTVMEWHRLRNLDRGRGLDRGHRHLGVDGVNEEDSGVRSRHENFGHGHLGQEGFFGSHRTNAPEYRVHNEDGGGGGGGADGSGPTAVYYTIAAWRCMVVKRGRTGLGGPDEFEVQGAADDGGERHAGKKILSVMEREGIIDALVVVSRRFGGTFLGPVRFTHVETCASEGCRKFKKVEEMEECVQTLHRLDDTLATLRAQLASMREEASTSNLNSPAARVKGAMSDYHIMEQDLDMNKAKRLVRARESAIQNTKTLIEKYKTSTVKAS